MGTSEEFVQKDSFRRCDRNLVLSIVACLLAMPIWGMPTSALPISQDANLRHANFSGANLYNDQLEGADLKGANLFHRRRCLDFAARPST